MRVACRDCDWLSDELESLSAAQAVARGLDGDTEHRSTIESDVEIQSIHVEGMTSEGVSHNVTSNDVLREKVREWRSRNSLEFKQAANEIEELVDNE